MAAAFFPLRREICRRRVFRGFFRRFRYFRIFQNQSRLSDLNTVIDRKSCPSGNVFSVYAGPCTAGQVVKEYSVPVDADFCVTAGNLFVREIKIRRFGTSYHYRIFSSQRYCFAFSVRSCYFQQHRFYHVNIFWNQFSVSWRCIFSLFSWTDLETAFSTFAVSPEGTAVICTLRFAI